jgi:hypothetical protein
VNWLKRKWIAEGEARMLSKVIAKFEDAHDQYFGQGDFESANLVVDLVAFLQDDQDGVSD